MLNNKIKQLSLLIVLLLLGLVLAACQRAEEPVQELCPVDELGEEQGEDCLTTPPELESEEAAYPIEEFAYVDVDEAAYPITEADLTWLLQSWRLTAYTSEGVESEPPFTCVAFYEDGSYVIGGGSGMTNGTWTSILLASESTLILNPGTGQVVRYQMSDLGETELSLFTWEVGEFIEMRYTPDDSGCVGE